MFRFGIPQFRSSVLPILGSSVVLWFSRSSVLLLFSGSPDLRFFGCLSRVGTSSVIVPLLPLHYCHFWMARNSDTLKVGDSAPSFSLWAANEFNAIGTPLEMRLQDLMQRGPVVLEFLRGTW